MMARLGKASLGTAERSEARHGWAWRGMGSIAVRDASPAGGLQRGAQAGQGAAGHGRAGLGAARHG